VIPIHDIRLIPLGAEDVDALQTMLIVSADYFQALGHAQVASDLAARMIRETESTPGRHLLGVDLKGELIGILDFRLRYPAPDTAQLGLLLLQPSWRAQGIGTLTMDIWETWLDVQTPIERVRSAVPAHLRQAQRFFLKRGYHLTGESYRFPIGNVQPRLLILEKLLGIEPPST